MDTETQIRKGHVKTEAETGVMVPQTKKCQEPPKLEETRKDSSLEPSEGAWPCQYIDLGLLASRTVKE